MLLRELHRGGQGVVYLGIQASTGRNVAVKVLHQSPSAEPGTAGVVRFEREIEILSRLKHPNVVTVHDCGRDGAHVYLVMDYVAGVALDAWVRREAPTRTRLLEVIARVCDGVNAAHLRGVIHRDLKPGNILVDANDEPHVVDFGLAKLAEGGHDNVDADRRAMTVTGQFIGSLPWASPEQAEGRTDERGGIDIRTDVYALGIILFQALTGQFPYPISGPIHEVVGHIVNAAPTRPSSFDRTIDRELDTIVLKCLAKEPDRRYQAAGDLARDLRRYLAGEAIEARRDSLVYLMTKRIERYRVAVIAALVMLAVVGSALAVSVLSWRQAVDQGRLAREAATRADIEAAQARAVTEFMREVLTSVEPQNDGADVRLVDVLERASREAPLRFAEHPAQEASVRDLLGQVYERLSMWRPARAEFTRAVALWNTCAGPDDIRTLESTGRLASANVNLLDTAEAVSILNNLLPRLERVAGPGDPRTLHARRLVAVTHLFRGRDIEAEEMLLELRAHPTFADDDHSQCRLIRALLAVYSARQSTDDAARRRAVNEQAAALAAEWIERSTRLAGPDAPGTLDARVKWAEFACALGRHEDAAEVARDVLDRASARLGPCHHVCVEAMRVLAEALTGIGQEQEPAALHLACIDCLRSTLDPDNLLFISGLCAAFPFIDRGGSGFAHEGEAIAREVLRGLATYSGGHGVANFLPACYLAHFVSAQGRLDEADALFASAWEQDADHANAPRMRACLRRLHARHLVRQGDFKRAETVLNEAAALVDDVNRGTWDSHQDDLIRAYVELYEAWGRPEEARTWSERLTG